jgi:hypothetical protein
MRGALMSIVGSGVRPTGLSCVTVIKLYKTIVLHRSLYGAELWSKLTKENITKLEKAQHFCLKVVQTLPNRTKSVIVQAMVNIYSIETCIDIKKLQFMGRLCRLDNGKLTKQIFLERLYQHLYANNEGLGFVADAVRILEKYGLVQQLEEYISFCLFPSKAHWKSAVDSSVKLVEERKLIFMLNDNTLRRFAQVYGVSLRFHPIWLMEHRAEGHRRHLRHLVKLNCVLCDRNLAKNCKYCGRAFLDHIDHYFHSCTKYQEKREYFWFLVINTCSVELSAHLYNLSDRDMSCVILGQQPAISVSENELTHLFTICAKTWQLLAYEKELKYY